MNQLFNLILTWQFATSTTTSIHRPRSNDEVNKWMEGLSSRVEESPLQNTDQPQHVQRKRSRIPVVPEPRIINGVTAPENRYPYSVSLQYTHQHYCGASLVAPDMILTAAHCGEIPSSIVIGRYNLNEVDDDYETFYGAKEIRHPDFEEETVNNDYLLIVLDGVSRFPSIILNSDENLPLPGEALVVMGWGDIDASDSVQTTSEYLRETTVLYMSSEQCELSEGLVQTVQGPTMGYYQGGISSNMMCAVDDVGTASDACQGDSGGALVYPGDAEDGSEDIQVGIVSWGFGCADPTFPGVYSRISSQYSWLKSTICSNSASPPAYLGCTSSSGASVVSSKPPTASPITQQELEGLITVFVETDPYNPQDLGWELSSVADGTIIDSRSTGYYANQYQEAVRHEVIVDPEQFYKLTIYDQAGDGFLGYMAVFKGRSYFMADVLVLEPGFSSVSGNSVGHGFYVGSSPERTLTLDLQFDNSPDELAWSITNVEDDLELGFKWFGWYGSDFTSATEIIPIFGNGQGTRQYILEVLDQNGDGMCCSQGQGSYNLYLGNGVDGNLIVSGGSFSTEDSSSFKVSSTGDVSLLTSTAQSQSVAVETSSFDADTAYYMVPATGICKLSDENQPMWITVTFSDFEVCCNESWNKQQCLDANPSSSIVTPNTIQFSPVTGSFSCSEPGLTCTVTCSGCGSIESQISDMTAEYADKSTIVYTSKGTSSSLVLIETDRSSMNRISCDKGCTCSIVNQNDLGCGMSPTQSVATSDGSSQYDPDQESSSVAVTARFSFLALVSILSLGMWFVS